MLSLRDRFVFGLVALYMAAATNVGHGVCAWVPIVSHSRMNRHYVARTSTARSKVCEISRRWRSTLGMGLLDSISSFLQDRDGDFIKLEETQSAFGPGPALLLYQVPLAISNEEIMDMISDGAPQAFRRGVQLCRVASLDDALLDCTVSDALDRVVKGVVSSEETGSLVTGCPVLFFSGFGNEEMMTTFNIVGKEIYEEMRGTVTPACAKAVPKAMNKPLRQVFEEISGDHMDAIMSNVD